LTEHIKTSLLEADVRRTSADDMTFQSLLFILLHLGKYSLFCHCHYLDIQFYANMRLPHISLTAALTENAARENATFNTLKV